MHKIRVELGSVQETLLIPLYGRAVESRKRNPVLQDRKAMSMVNAIDYDFAKFDGKRSLFGASLRSAIFDVWIREFVARHPQGTVVEMGCGLNTRFDRLDNGSIHWLDFDLPDSIALRRKFFDDSDRCSMHEASVLETDWLDRVAASPGPYFVVIEAVLLYLGEAGVRRTLRAMAERLPGALLAFDTAGRFMIEQQSRHDVMPLMDARFEWACDDLDDLRPLGLVLRDSCTFADPPPALRGAVPWALWVLGPLLFAKAIASYRCNLFELHPPR